MYLRENEQTEDLYRQLRTLTASRLSALSRGAHDHARECERQRMACLARLEPAGAAPPGKPLRLVADAA